MKHNGYVSNAEKQLKSGSILVSKTDLKGAITYCNREFIEISGFAESELMGKNHNIVRHPDMPPEAFADLWKCIDAEKPWSGIVKNRAKNGDFYWVCANVTPLFKNGEVVEYMSVRTAPSREEITAAQALYTDINSGKQSLQPNGMSRLLGLHNKLSTSGLLYSTIAGSVISQVLVAAMIYYNVSSHLIYALLGTAAVLSVVAGVWITRRATAPLKYAIGKLRQISQGNYFDWINTSREDEFGDLLLALRSTQTQLGFEVLDARERAFVTNRIKTALDNVAANVVIADTCLNVIYANQSLTGLFSSLENRIQATHPDFLVSRLIGSKLNLFDSKAEDGLNSLQSTLTKDVVINTLHLRFIATPIIDEKGRRAGIAVEWFDRTQQEHIEDEIQSVVDSAKAGDLSHRLDTAGREGFYRRLGVAMNELMEINNTVIQESISSLNALAAGDLTRKVEGDYKGGFNDLKQSINATISQLTGVIEKIKQTAESVEEGVSEISTGNANLSCRTQSQATSLEDSACSIEQVSGTSKMTAENSLEASKLAEKARLKAEIGGRVVGETVTAMEEIKLSSQRISAITSTIDGIAFQTNLLALNAAVEAAHAGEQGRGFAVVASEVRELAQRSANAAKEVQALVKDSLEKVKDGTSLVARSGETLEEIIAESGRVSTVMGQISSAGQEQAIGIEQINQTISKLERTTQENTGLVDATARASDSLRAQTAELATLVEGFRLPEPMQQQETYRSVA